MVKFEGGRKVLVRWESGLQVFADLGGSGLQKAANLILFFVEVKRERREG